MKRIAVYTGEGMGVSWNMTAAVLARIGQEECEKVKLSVVSVIPKCSQEYAEATEELYRYCVSIGAEMNVLYSKQPAYALLNFVSANKINELYLDEKSAESCLRLIERLAPNVKVNVIAADCIKIYGVVPVGLFCCAVSEG